MSAPFLWLFIVFSAGIISASGVYVPLVLVLAAGGCAAGALRCKSFGVALAAGLLFVFLLGEQSMQTSREAYTRNSLRTWIRAHEQATVELVGVVSRTPEISSDFFVLHVRVISVSGTSVDGIARLAVTGLSSQYPLAGDMVQTYARLRLPASFRVPGSFNYERYLETDRVDVIGSVKDASLIHTTGERSKIAHALSALRFSLIREITRRFSSSDSALLRALWLDDRNGLSQSTEQSMIDAGVFHVIAISGFHVSVLLLVLFLALKRLVPFPVALLMALLLLVFYFLLLEGRSAITRSFITFLVFAFAFWCKEEIRWSNALPLSAWIQLLINPNLLFDTGYQLTYLSTASLLFVAAPLCKRVRLKRRVYRYVVQFLITALSIQLVTIPYQAFVFHRIPYAAIAANIIAVPLSSVLIGSGIILAVPFPQLVGAGTWCIHVLLQIFVTASSFFGELYPTYAVEPARVLVISFYTLLALAFMFRRMRIRLICFAGSAFCFFLIVHPPERSPAGALRIHFLDVGQGDAILLEYPNGKFDLIDAGGFWNREALDTGEAVLIPYLSHLRVRHLNRIFLTHAHADHMNGMFTLLHYVKTDRFYVSRKPYGTFEFRRLLWSIPLSPTGLSSGTEFCEGGVRVRVLAPDHSVPTRLVANDDSIVLMLEYQGKRILLTGDAEAPTEDKLGQLLNLQADYLKVAHHGSDSSSTSAFLDRVKPRMAFISVGQHNWFGHPHPDVLNRLRRHHALIFRTDQLGTMVLTISSRGTSLQTYAWNP
jgi:competence protein ComEC